MPYQNIVIAPDSFKESLTAKQVCESIKKGFLEVLPEANISMIPMADGGEGTVQALIDATGGELITVDVHDPLGKKIKSFFGLLGDGKTAIIEMAAASGIELLNDLEKDPFITSTYGTGDLILAALDKGCNKIIMGIGGSATNDGGAGMIQALGGHLLDKNNEELKSGGGNLAGLAGIDNSGLDPRLKNTEFIVACDVDNPLLGKNGASYIFGPQKGASKTGVKELDKNLEHFANIVESYFRKNIRDYPGAGAAGGLGFGMMAFLNASLKPGFDVVAQQTNIEKSIQKADLVITGEGKLDSQTRYGKTPYGVALLAKKYDVPVIAFAGLVENGTNELYKNIFEKIVPIASEQISQTEAMENAAALLRQATSKAIREFIANDIL